MRLVLLSLLASACFAQTVALTFDDLPLGGVGDHAEAVRANTAILAALKKYNVPAVAFVIEKKVRDMDGASILHQWTASGHELANHSFAHPNFNDLSVAEFQKQIIDGEATIGKVRYFRFPMNHTGDTKEKHDAMAAFLKQRGYTMAPCTIENVDYMFARVYRELHGAEARKLRTEYLDFTSRMIDYLATEQRRALGGKEVPHIMLLHANMLNADTLPEILKLFVSKHYKFVKLETAMSDPIYAKPDTFITKQGPMWAFRWAQENGVALDERAEPEVPAWIVKAYRVLQNQ